MHRRTLSIEVSASCEQAFDLIHDYSRRPEWDRMLREARLLGDAAHAEQGVRTLCTGTWRSAWIGMETEYVTFERGRVAAVKLTNRPPFFDRFAASIRHEPLAPDRSRVTYTYAFRARPRPVARLVEPLLDTLLARETRNRLEALRDILARERSTSPEVK